MPDASGTSDCFLFFFQSAVLRQDGRVLHVEVFLARRPEHVHVLLAARADVKTSPFGIWKRTQCEWRSGCVPMTSPTKIHCNFPLGWYIGMPLLAITQGITIDLTSHGSCEGEHPKFYIFNFFWPECCDSIVVDFLMDLDVTILFL